LHFQTQDWFSINPSNGTLSINSPLDREQADHLLLTITVQDLNAAPNFSPQTATAHLRLNIHDTNDNHPHFPQARLLNPAYLALNEPPVYQLTSKFEENLATGTSVLKLLATDPDLNTQITYQLLAANNSLLSLDPHTGNIYTSAVIDYEQQHSINATVLAFDTDSKNKAILHIHFQIEDLNDNEPVFNSVDSNSPTEINVSENAAVNSSVARFTATDLDSTLYAPIAYQLLSGDEGKFYIDSTSGTLYIKSELDRETQPFYTLVIRAKDNALSKAGKQLSSSILVKINVRDINDNSPYCASDSYTATINHNAEINSNVLGIKGLDNDIGLNAQIGYSFTEVPNCRGNY